MTRASCHCVWTFSLCSDGNSFVSSDISIDGEEATDAAMPGERKLTRTDMRDLLQVP